jgi:CHAT domain-containing protein/tetratricopeptide (TPR) repeat protein
MRIIDALFIAMFLYSCGQANTPQPQAKPDAAVMRSASSDTAERLYRLLSTPDSFASYINLNKQLYDSLLDSNWVPHGSQYLHNIIREHERAVKDTALRELLVYAYYHTGYYADPNIYNENIVNSFEQFLLLTKNRPPKYADHGYIFNVLGVQYNILGDLKKSFYYYNEYANYSLQHKDYNAYAAYIINKAIALNELGQYDSTIHLIKATLRMPGIAQKRMAKLYAYMATAQSKSHLYAQALANANISVAIIDELAKEKTDEDILERKYQVLWNLGEIQSFSGNDAAAANTLDSALKYAFLTHGNKNREAGKILIARGRIAENGGKLQEALSCYHKALSAVTGTDSNSISQSPAQETLYTENTIMEALDAKAGVLEKLYRETKDIKLLELAVHCYELSFEVENKLMQGFSYDESLERQAAESRQRSEKAITACHLLFTLTMQHNWAEKAFLFAERSKAVVLQQSIRKNIAANNILQNDTLLQKVRLLQQQVADFEKDLYYADDTAEIAALKRQKYAAENELLSARTALMHSGNGYREALVKADSLSVSMLKNKLENSKTSIVEFFEGENNTWAFIISKNLPVQFLQYDSSLTIIMDSLLQYFTDASLINNDPAGFQQAAYKVYHALEWEQTDKGWEHVIIIPDGRFSMLPFDALITQPSAALNLQQAPFLLHHYEVTYAYSAAILLMKPERSAASGNTLVSFAPVFSGHERGQQPLVNTLNEIESIHQYKQGEKFVSGNASLSNFKKALTAAGILHIATHTYADTSANSMPRIEFIDSSLLLTELYALQTKASLVVLSGCETGIGRINRSEGPISLARGFYYAGAANVITSYWNVDDKSTAELFIGLYSNINKVSYHRSLHLAKLNFIRNAPDASASPYYWAGFVYIGNPQNADEKNSMRWWWLLLPLFLLIGAWLYKRK